MTKPIPTTLHKKNRYAPTYDDRRCEHTVNGVLERFDIECGTKRCREWFEASFFSVFGANVSRNESRCFIDGTPQTLLVGEDVHTWTCLRCVPRRNGSLMVKGVLVDVCKGPDGYFLPDANVDDGRAEGDVSGYVDGTELLVNS